MVHHGDYKTPIKGFYKDPCGSWQKKKILYTHTLQSSKVEVRLVSFQ